MRRTPPSLRPSRRATAILLLALPAPLAVADAIWTPAGPAPTTGGQSEGIPNNPVAGAIKQVAVSPADPTGNTLYVGTVNGGIWKTTNGLAASPTWTPLSDFQTSLSIGALRFDPTDVTGNTLVAGIGRFSSDAGLGGAFTGLLRTTNGGTSFTPITSLAGKEISGVAARGSTLIASIDFANSFTFGNIGIYRSTNGGASFTQISGSGPSTAPNGLFGGRAFDLAADPTNNNTLYTAIRDAGANDGLYRSTDAGASWARVGSASLTNTFNDNSTVNAKIAVGNNGQVYIGIQNNGQLAGLFRSPDGVNNWTQLDTPVTNQNGFLVGINPEAQLGGGEESTSVPPLGSTEDTSGGQGFIHFSIAADPTNPNLVYVGGDRQPSQLNGSGQETGQFPNSIGANNFSGRLFRVDASLAAGSQATPITNSGAANNSSPHADSRSLTFANATTLLESDDGGVFLRGNPASPAGAWTALNTNLHIAEIHDLAYDRNTHTILAGTQDTGTPEQATQGALPWRSVSQGDGGVPAVDNHTPGASVRYSYFTFLFGFHRRAFNNTGTLTSDTFPGLNVVGVNLPVNHQNATGAFDVDPGLQFYNPIATNTSNGDLLVGGQFVYESTDGGSNLNRLGDLGQSNHVTALAGGGQSPTPNPALLYAFGTSKTFARRTTGAANSSVTLLTTYSAAANADAVALSVSTLDWHDLFVADPAQVFRSVNAGDAFTNITGNLGSLETNLHSLAEVTANNLEFLLAGGDNGVFLTGGPAGFGAWTELGAATLPNAPVFSLVYDPVDDILVAGTLGRGAWTIPNFSAALIPEPDTPILLLTALATLTPLTRHRRRHIGN